jgi:glycosyltransferase involved in cell wall biosynthesis
MKISVLIPTYNSAPYLAECLESVLAQDFDDLEILISDDQSTDETLQIIRNFAARDQRIRWWQNPNNLGSVGNHNLCLREARGEYLKFIHHDDKLSLPSAISKLATALDANPTVLLVSSPRNLIDSNSRIIGRQAFLRPGVWDGKVIIKSCFEFEPAANYIGDQTQVMFRGSEVIARGFRSDYLQYADVDLWFYLLEKGKFVFLPETLSAYRSHSTQVGATIQGKAKNDVELLMLMEMYWAKPWIGQLATRRMICSQIRFLKKKRSRFGRWTAQSDALLAQMECRVNPICRAIFWVEHKILRSFKMIRRLYNIP